MCRLVLLAVLALGTTVARAESGLFYLGAGVTKSSMTANLGGVYSAPTDLKNTSWKAFAGVRPLKWLAVEADYIDLGSGSTRQRFNNESSIDAYGESSAWAAYAVGFLPVPLPVVDVYGKAGVARWRLHSSFSVVSNSPPYDTWISSTSSTTGTDFAWGIGVQAHVKMFGLRLEYERFEGFEVNKNTANVASLSVFLNF